jgi:hypothetical protein
MRLFKGLGLSEKQKDLLADEWELWSARRFALDSQFSRARGRLESMLPSHKNMHALLMSFYIRRMPGGFGGDSIHSTPADGSGALYISLLSIYKEWRM